MDEKRKILLVDFSKFDTNRVLPIFVSKQIEQNNEFINTKNVMHTFTYKINPNFEYNK